MKEIKFFKDMPEIEAGFSVIGQTSGQVRAELAGQGLLVVRPVQVHRDQIRMITEELRRECQAGNRKELVFEDTDGIMTCCQGVALTTIHGDCLPIYLYDRKTGAMGLAHGGWKGSCLGIGAKLAKTMEKEMAASMDSMSAAIGPGVGFCCFEVGEEVYEAFAGRYDYIDEFARKKDNGKYNLDLKGINRRQLTDLGIRDIEVSPLCTACSRDPQGGGPLFYSYRREEADPRRMAAYLYRRP